MDLKPITWWALVDVKTSTLGAGIWSWKNDTHFKHFYVYRECVLVHVSDTNLDICALHSLKSLEVEDVRISRFL